jgi:tetratricopeptide (TPR) repeat protein
LLVSLEQNQNNGEGFAALSNNPLSTTTRPRPLSAASRRDAIHPSLSPATSSRQHVNLQDLHTTLLRGRNQDFGAGDLGKPNRTLIWIGDENCRRQEWSKAVDAYKDAFKYFHPEDKHNIAVIYTKLGTVYHRMGDMKRSVAYLQKALKPQLESVISQGRDPSKSLAVATSYFRLGKALRLHHEYETALDVLNRALRIQQRVKSADAALTCEVINKVQNSLARSRGQVHGL